MRSFRFSRVLTATSLPIAILTFLFVASAAPAAPGRVVAPFESEATFTPVNEIDRLVLASLRRRGIEPAHLCSDEVFLRRVYLDMIGTLPEMREVQKFQRDRDPDKRAKTIEALFEREEFADYWALKWCDVLRVKAEFPINLWPNGVQLYHRYIYEAVRDNKPYDRFARELLTSCGSNFRVAPVNFYRAVQGEEPSALAAAAALTFMGTRVENWPAERRAGFEAFFSRVGFKGTAEWKETIVYVDPTPTEPLEATLPDGRRVSVPVGDDPRVVFADWLIADDNPWFARYAVNRYWFWLMGRGIVHEADDIRDDNPPSNPELLEYLEKEFVRSGYNMRSLFRLILNSRVYQQSSIPRSDHPEAEALFAYYAPRRLDAEALIDALCDLSGVREEYSSPIPEPFTYIPEEHQTIELADGSITSQFLEMFGRPSRDTGLLSERNNQVTEAQRLHLINSTHVQEKIEKGHRFRRLIDMAKRDQERLVRSLYLTILSRHPTDDELSAAQAYLGKGSSHSATRDLIWALINSKEFLYRH